MLYSNGVGRYNREYQELWDRLVPISGQADTVQGELVRAIGKLASECYRNCNENWDWGFRILTNFLYRHLRNPAVFDAETIAQTERDIAEIRGMGNGTLPLEYTDEEDAFDRITDRVVEWCQANRELIVREHNPKLLR